MSQTITKLFKILAIAYSCIKGGRETFLTFLGYKFYLVPDLPLRCYGKVTPPLSQNQILFSMVEAWALVMTSQSWPFFTNFAHRN